jgi:threonylcarbamoyladenosine tRNA methylthiotransferase MtaB
VRIFFDMVGCRVNEAEIELMIAEASSAGCGIAEDPSTADWIVINTCTVTRSAERDSRRMIRRAHARNPAARMAVTGCWATMEPGRAAALPGVSRVFPNAEKHRVLAEILAGWPAAFRSAAAFPAHTRRRTRAFIKVQDGCDNACAYCVTRLARGPLRSRPAEVVVRDIHAAERMGVKEAVLAGVHLGAWGKDLDIVFGLERLVETVLEGTSIPRLRLSSIEPWEVRPKFFRLWRNGRLCPHLHLPLQSGCAATLSRMRRRTTPEEFARLVAAARTAIPDLAVTSDLIVGFPGESAEEFRESLDFVGRMGFARLHVFRFSPRPGTEAAGMPGALPAPEIRRRSEQARQTAKRCSKAFAVGFLGREMEVLWESETRRGVRRGLTPNYLRVRAPAHSTAPNTVSRVRLAAYERGEILGEV